LEERLEDRVEVEGTYKNLDRKWEGIELGCMD